VQFLAVVTGSAVVVAVLADMVNTLVTTSTSTKRWWLTRVAYRVMWRTVRRVARRRDGTVRESLLSAFAPVSVLVLLGVWVTQQILGFALVWWGLGGIDGAVTFADHLYYSGVVYFTLGFGELVPAAAVPRVGALLEAFAGVLTTALVIGYLPALYGAYGERERRLMTLDDGGEDRITPTNLVIARAPDGDHRKLDGFFKEWEDWIAGVIETHTTFPMLAFFRSKDPGQNWVTAVGLVTDAALHIQMVRGAEGGQAYWTIRRAIQLFQTVIGNNDLAAYLEPPSDPETGARLFRELYEHMAEHGFDLVDFETARERGAELRSMYGPAMEFLIDELVAPRGFWAHAVGHRVEHDDHSTSG
jgi:hypothetical protein